MHLNESPRQQQEESTTTGSASRRPKSSGGSPPDPVYTPFGETSIVITECIRPYLRLDELAVVGVWHRAGRAAYAFLPTWQDFTPEQALVVFRQVIAPQCALWVGTQGRRVVAYLALKQSY